MLGIKSYSAKVKTMKIGFFGTGLMGQAMVKKLLQGELPVIAYNRTESKLESLKALGADITTDPTQAIREADCLILMLADAIAIEEVILADPSLLANRTVIQMATIAPSQSKNILQAVQKAQGDYLEAPVLGSIPQVKEGTLQVMVGATEVQFQQWSSLLQHFGKPDYIGEVGTASALKLALNQLIASLTSAFSLSLGFVQREGVSVDKFMEILRESALYSPTFDKKLERMQNRDFSNPNFPTKHLLKDTDLFLNQAQADSLNVSSLEGVQKIVQKAIELGLSNVDYSSVFSAINPPE